MRNRNDNSAHTSAYTTRSDHKVQVKRNKRARYDDRHNCAEYVAQYNAFKLGVDYER